MGTVSEWLWSYAVMTILLWAGFLLVIGTVSWIGNKRKERQWWADTDAMQCGVCESHGCQGRCI